MPSLHGSFLYLFYLFLAFGRSLWRCPVPACSVEKHLFGYMTYAWHQMNQIKMHGTIGEGLRGRVKGRDYAVSSVVEGEGVGYGLGEG